MDEKIIYYQLSPKQVLETLKSNINGLTDNEITTRLDTYGKNTLKITTKTPKRLRFLKQFKDALIILLIVSAGISIYLQDYRGATILSIIVLTNAIIGYIQEAKAEKIMKSLKKMIHPTAKVKRNGNLIEEKSENLVPGDIVFLEEGDNVSADIRIIEENELLANDFSLTGESNPINKFTHAILGNVALGERNNCLRMGTTIAVGNVRGVVIATGMDTELGKIANLSQETQIEDTPLQKEMTNIAQKLSIGTVILGAILLFVALIGDFSIREAFIFAIGIAAAMVPQGLPAQVNMALSLAAGRLAKNKALVKQLASVETLGCVNIICTDKTGTLTKNEMTVRSFFLGNKSYEVSGSGYEPIGEISDTKNNILDKTNLIQPEQKYFFQTMFMNNNAKVNPPDKEHPLRYAIGDPTEAALISLVKKIGFDTNKNTTKKLHQYGFDSIRKMMSTVYQTNDEIIVYLKGSPRSVLEKCEMIYDGKRTKKITKKDKAEILDKIDNLASQARRNLAIAYRKLDNYDHDTMEMEEVESKLVFLGFVSIIDPPREEVYDAIKTAYESHIKIIMITGDYGLTAKAIAEEIGFGKEGKIKIINGDKLRSLSDIELVKHLANEKYIIFSRSSPEDKMRIVNLLKKHKNIVAVTGDGINDAPALKNANIGVSMGKIGTDVAKEASEIVLMDDSFNTLIYAIRQGRIIYQNLKKTILSSITSNGGELFAILASLVARGFRKIPLAINPVQILAIDLIGEMGPLMALTRDPADKDILINGPRDVNKHLINKTIVIDLLRSGFLMGILGFGNYILYFLFNGVSPIGIDKNSIIYMTATSITYTSIIFIQFMNILSRRTNGKSILSRYLRSNKKLLASFGLSILMIIILIYIPAISNYFGFGRMKLIDRIFPIGGGLLFLITRETQKYIQRK